MNLLKNLLFMSLSISSLLACGGQRPELSEVREKLSQYEDANAVPANERLQIGWNEPFKAAKLGLQADPLLEGKTIDAIIGSRSSGRDDGMLCSACHNRNDAPGGYGPSVDFAKSSPSFNALENFQGRTWAGKGGWAEGFISNKTKPENLKQLMKAWGNKGYK